MVHDATLVVSQFGAASQYTFVKSFAGSTSSQAGDKSRRRLVALTSWAAPWRRRSSTPLSLGALVNTTTWHQIKSILEQVLEQPQLGRHEFLARACAGKTIRKLTIDC